MTFGDFQNPRKCKWADAASLVSIESHFKLSISALLRAMFDVGIPAEYDPARLFAPDNGREGRRLARPRWATFCREQVQQK
jgi:hypothetical protein